MDNKHELRKKTLGVDLVCVFGGVFVAIIGFLFINYFINAGTQKQLYYILAWLIPANAILFSFWFLINIIAKHSAITKKILHGFIILGEITLMIRIAVYLITGITFGEYMATIAGMGNI
ncbi:hypothetical protein [Yeguia hominis]|uniref:Uncharacterized protein n=1 Tax=Yeguia hominis TaxID=2763662 RepID=A0A926D917_9FIRM|nr:hypothetical protein [Yeguia hominis]MBC8533602.1 hypothetical protein [Yeguia hominis]